MRYNLKKDGSVVTAVGLKEEFPSLDWETGEMTIKDDGFVLDSEHPNAYPDMESGCFALQETNPNLKPGDEFWYRGKLFFTVR